MPNTLKNRPKLFEYYESPDPYYPAVRKEVNGWFEGFTQRQRDLLSQLVTIASNNADSVISLGDTKFELTRAERYGIILYIRKEIFGE